jgi:hypothetical protein
MTNRIRAAELGRVSLALIRAAGAVACLSFAIAACGSGSKNATIGVTECDDYVAKIQACMAKDPRAKAMEAGFKAQRDAWKQMAATNRDTARANCTAALEALATALPTCR